MFKLWLESYLKERRQCVRVKNALPGYLYLLVGVPQSSILGHLLLFFYISGLPGAGEFLNPIFLMTTRIFSIAKISISCFC